MGRRAQPEMAEDMARAAAQGTIVCVHRLSPRQTQSLASLICGDAEDSPVEYRRMVDIESFLRFSGAEFGGLTSGTMSRWNYACMVIESAQDRSSEGASGLGAEVEKIIEALLDLREFHSEDRRDEALLKVNNILRGLPVEARVRADGSVQIVSTRQTRAQRVLDEQIHTVFGQTLSDSALGASRTHYAKAQRYLAAAEPDYENAAKEAVSSVESLVRVLTGETDYTRAIKKATDAGLIPRPIDELAIKLFAYRGNEPGVAHGAAETPDVSADEARLIFNLAGALGAYLAVSLRKR
jgi:hypothetical protein